jgi:hypothetical protein
VWGLASRRGRRPGRAGEGVPPLASRRRSSSGWCRTGGQLVVDLPKQGPTRALISHGFYLWGLTGGNSDIKNVRVRGFDAQGKQIYDVKKDVDADFD